jgi:hypothetical protein
MNSFYDRRTQAELRNLKRSIDIMSTTVNAGLAALQQADSDLAVAVTANTTATQAALADIQTLLTELGTNEDPAVQSLAADIETKITALQASTSALSAAVAPPTTGTTAASAEAKKA